MAPFASTRHRELQRAAARIMAAAERAKLTVTTAESCTAGQLVGLLAAQHAASRALDGGFVVYSKASKAAVLGVSRALLRRHTAVSREVACEMAKGALRRSRSSLAIAITGVAGPSRDEDGNPVGLVFIAVARRGPRLFCERRQLRGKDPGRNLLTMHRVALAMLGKAIG